MNGLHPAILNHASPWRLKTTFPITRAHLTGADPSLSGEVSAASTSLGIGAMFLVIGMFVGVGYLYKNYQ